MDASGGMSSFSFSAGGVVWTSVLSSATVVSAAHTAGVWVWTGVSSTALLWGHTAAHRAIEPSYPLSQTPMFQCLLLEDGQEPEWCEGERLTSLGGSWMPSIGQAPDWHDGSVSFLWQTLEDGALTKYFLSPAQCSHFLHLAEIAGCPPPAEIEALLLKQGGAYQSPDPFNASVCGRPPRSGRKQRSETASDCQLTLFPLC